MNILITAASADLTQSTSKRHQTTYAFYFLGTQLCILCFYFSTLLLNQLKPVINHINIGRCLLLKVLPYLIII